MRQYLTGFFLFLLIRESKLSLHGCGAEFAEEQSPSSLLCTFCVFILSPSSDSHVVSSEGFRVGLISGMIWIPESSDSLQVAHVPGW